MSLPVRIGIGYDLHRLAPDRPLLLGGVAIPSDVGALGHSDADVVLHALTDALLGAVGGPDIGDLFPDNDPRWAGADSRHFLAAAHERVRSARCTVGNVDVIIHAQRPRLGPHKQTIAHNLANLLDIPRHHVAVKATTNEGLDAIGRGEAIAAWVAVTLIPTTT